MPPVLPIGHVTNECAKPALLNVLSEVAHLARRIQQFAVSVANPSLRASSATSKHVLQNLFAVTAAAPAQAEGDEASKSKISGVLK